MKNVASVTPKKKKKGSKAASPKSLGRGRKKRAVGEGVVGNNLARKLFHTSPKKKQKRFKKNHDDPNPRQHKRDDDKDTGSEDNDVFQGKYAGKTARAFEVFEDVDCRSLHEDMEEESEADESHDDPILKTPERGPKLLGAAHEPRAERKAPGMCPEGGRTFTLDEKLRMVDADLIQLLTDKCSRTLVFNCFVIRG